MSSTTEKSTPDTAARQQAKELTDTLIKEARFPGTSAAALATILETGLDQLELAAARVASQGGETFSIADLDGAYTAMVPERHPTGHGWVKGNDGLWWFDRVATLLIPHSLPAGSRIEVSGSGRCGWRAPAQLSCQIEGKALSVRNTWISPGAWTLKAVTSATITPRFHACTITLMCPSRGSIRGLKDADAPSDIASLGVERVRILPPSVLQQPR